MDWWYWFVNAFVNVDEGCFLWLFVSVARQRNEGKFEWKQEGRGKMLTLTWSLALYPYRYIYLLTWCHTIRPMTTKPTYNYNTAHLRRHGCPLHSPRSAHLPSSFCGCDVTCDLGWWPKAAEWQRDAGTVCEGRRGRSPDLSEWRRPTREMYTLPLLLLYSYIVTFLPISTSTQQT